MTDVKTATDHLRKLLDERGMEWKDYGYENHTWWNGSENVGWHAENSPRANGLYVKIEAVLTPEQAIAATLGSGTCHMSFVDEYETASGEEEYLCECSECGYRRWENAHDLPLFCSKCGRKVKR